MQGLEVEALIGDHQAAPLLHQGGQLNCRCIVLDLLTELDQPTVVKDGFRRTLPCTCLHSTVSLKVGVFGSGFGGRGQQKRVGRSDPGGYTCSPFE